jgi:hypothetical protein
VWAAANDAGDHTAQVVKSWGDGWEDSVLPLLKQENGSGRAPSMAEERIIGAGLKSLKGEDVGSIDELFRMFAVTTAGEQKANMNHQVQTKL